MDMQATFISFFVTPSLYTCFQVSTFACIMVVLLCEFHVVCWEEAALACVAS